MANAANEQRRYVYMIRAGHVVKVGCSRNPIGRWKALKPFLSIYGKPEFAGYVEGDLNDEKRVYGMGEPFPDAQVREIRLGSTIPDLATIFPFRTVYYPDPDELARPDSAFRRLKVPSDHIPYNGPYPKGTTFLTVERLLAEDLTRNYKSIADEVGVTRERVRQIAVRLGDTAAARREIRKDLAFQARTRIPGFARLVRKWISDTGCGYCGLSDHEGPRVVDHPTPRYRCRACNVRKSQAWYGRPENKAKVRAYYKTERGKAVAARSKKRWLAKLPSTYSRERYRRIMDDPQKAERKRTYEREYWRRRGGRKRNRKAESQ